MLHGRGMQAQLPPAPLRGQAIRRRIGCPSTSMHRGHGRSGSNKEPLAALAPATAEVDILMAVRPVQTDQLLPIALDAVQQGADLFDEGCPLSDVGEVEELLGILSRQAQSAQGGAAASCWAAQTSAPRAAAMSGQKRERQPARRYSSASGPFSHSFAASPLQSAGGDRYRLRTCEVVRAR